MSDSAGDAVITSFHHFISFILLSFIVSLFHLCDQVFHGAAWPCLIPPSASKERKHRGDRPVKYNDDKCTDRLHLIDVCAKDRKWKDLSRRTSSYNYLTSILKNTEYTSTSTMTLVLRLL